MWKKDFEIERRLAALAANREVATPVLKKLDPVTRHREPRRAVFQNGYLAIGLQAKVRCAIVNLSTGGARIAMEGAYALPEVVVLIGAQSHFRKRARIAWQQGRDAGLEFITDADEDSGEA